MRDVYLNDIGDYVKYALLRELSGADVETAGPGQLGVLWYLTVHEETNNDGCHRGYLDRPDFAPLDPDLFSQMHSLERRVADGVLRHGVNLLEHGGPAEGYLPGARLHSLPLEKITGPPAKVRGLRRQAREEWWGGARRAVFGCPVVFLDPDNGVRPLGVDDGHRDEPKYCRREEVVELIGDHDLVVVYQHADRSGWDALRSGIVAAVREDLGHAGRQDAADTSVHTLVASTYGRRGFICFARTPGAAKDARVAIEALIARAKGGPLDKKLALDSD